jgi:hypothetical protein
MALVLRSAVWGAIADSASASSGEHHPEINSIERRGADDFSRLACDRWRQILLAEPAFNAGPATPVAGTLADTATIKILKSLALPTGIAVFPP